MARGALGERLRRIAPAVVARELPVLVAPAVGADRADEDRGPVGASIGAIDLLYRDPDSGEWVVADFKTDRIESEAALRERVAHHAVQGRCYQRATQQALGLEHPPRFELWFLDADRVEPLTLPEGG
jgi:ATP-dependent exoDNAse (exonuclease V) beta subunit